MPFGLYGGAATFKRMMVQALCGTEDFAAALLDDLVVFSATWEDENLREILRRLREACLTAKSKKCTWVM